MLIKFVINKRYFEDSLAFNNFHDSNIDINSILNLVIETRCKFANEKVLDYYISPTLTIISSFKLK